MKATPILTLPVRPWRLVPGAQGIAIEVREGGRQSLEVWYIDYWAALKAHKSGASHHPAPIQLPWKAAVTAITGNEIEWVEYDPTGAAAKGPGMEIMSDPGQGAMGEIIEPATYQESEEGYAELARLIEILCKRQPTSPIEYLEWGAAFVLCFYLWTENGAERWLWVMDAQGVPVLQCLTQTTQQLPPYTPGPYLLQPPFLSVLLEPQTYQLFSLEF